MPMPRVKSCEECGNLDFPWSHKETCSKFEHIPDDHYDSGCMRGTCKYCFPEKYDIKTATGLDLDHLIIKKLRSIFSNEEMLRNFVLKIKGN